MMRTGLLFVIVFLVVVMRCAPSVSTARATRHIYRALPTHSKRLMARWRPVTPAAAEDPVIRPTDYGADPTGRTDSTAAFQMAVAAALARNTSGRTLSYGSQDLGGVCLDLSGGDYIVNSPLVFPTYVGNFRVIDGSLRAGPSFPLGRYLIEVGDSTCKNGQGSCNQDVGLEGLFLDGSQVAAGGIKITATMGANVGPQVYIVNFTHGGIVLDGGHETMIHESWIGEYLYDQKVNRTNTAYGIRINGNDHFVTNTIVFSGSVGVHVGGAANLLTGVHTWNDAWNNGGIGILVTSSQNRFEGCYLDHNDVVFENTQGQVFLNAFFYSGGAIVLRPTQKDQPVYGFYVAGCDFRVGERGSNVSIMTDLSQGSFGKVTDFVVQGLIQSGYQLTSPRATAQLTQTTPSTKWDIDFSKLLAIPASSAPIVSVVYSFVLDSGFDISAARPPEGPIVTVETNAPVTGTIFITVDQSHRS